MSVRETESDCWFCFIGAPEQISLYLCLLSAVCDIEETASTQRIDDGPSCIEHADSGLSSVP